MTDIDLLNEAHRACAQTDYRDLLRKAADRMMALSCENSKIRNYADAMADAIEENEKATADLENGPVQAAKDYREFCKP